VADIKPAVVPWLGRATSRVALLSVQVDAAALRSAFEEYVRRTVQTVTTPGHFGRGESEPEERPVPPGVLHMSLAVEQRVAQLQRLQDFAHTRDPIEAVHQLRVASRHLRAFVDMFAPFVDPALVRSVRGPLGQITRAVRDVRDADVQAQGLEARLRTATSEAERIAVNHLLDRVHKRRVSRAARAEKRLKKLDFGQLAVTLRTMLDQVALRAQAPSASYRLVAEVAYQPIVEEARAAAPDLSEPPSAVALHEFRLALKKLRYGSELIQPALGDRFDAIRDHAKALQGMLGEHQDCVEFERLVSKRHAKAVKSGRSTLAAGLEGILDRTRRERELCRHRCIEECSRLPGSHLFAGFTRAPHALPSAAS
jgi:CHAD domain-containing protein